MLYSEVIEAPDFDITDQRISEAIVTFLMQAGTIAQNTAKELAPYDRGTLRSSIMIESSQLYTGQVEVGSHLEYATVREFVNKRNPGTRFYMKRAKENNSTRFADLLLNAIQGALSS